MKIGGGGNEVWLVVIPVAFGALLVVSFFGGPSELLNTMERFAYDVLDSVRVLLRS